MTASGRAQLLKRFGKSASCYPPGRSRCRERFPKAFILSASGPLAALDRGQNRAGQGGPAFAAFSAASVSLNGDAGMRKRFGFWKQHGNCCKKKSAGK